MKTWSRYLYLPIDQSRLGRNCLCLPIERIRVTTRAGLPMSTNWKDTSYDSILVIINRLTCWEDLSRDFTTPMQITINAPGLAEVFIDLVVRHGPPQPPRLDHRRLRLSLHFQVLVPAVPISGSVAVTRLRAHRTRPPRGRLSSTFRAQIDRLMELVYDEPVQLTIDTPRLAKVFVNLVIRHHGLFNSIVSNRCSVVTLKFWSSLCYFLSIKQRRCTAFRPQTDRTAATRKNLQHEHKLCMANLFPPDLVRFRA